MNYKPKRFYIPNNFTYIGIDETGMKTSTKSNGALFIVAAETNKKKLTYSYDWGTLKKAKDILNNIEQYLEHGGDPKAHYAPRFPKLEYFTKKGLTNFHWTRASYGRFNRQEIEHLGIANILTSNGYNPKKTVLMIDAFHTNISVSKYVIRGYLKRLDFNIPDKNIIICSGGDKSVPIINIADILAFQLKLHHEKKHKEFLPETKEFLIKPNEIPYDKHRIASNLDEDDRNTLARILYREQGVTKYKGYFDETFPFGYQKTTEVRINKEDLISK